MSKTKLLDQVRQALRLKYHSLRTEETYVHWITRFILYHHKRHPGTMNFPEIQDFLPHLIVTDHSARKSGAGWPCLAVRSPLDL